MSRNEADGSALDPTDEQLAIRARDGDAQAFNRLMQRHAPRLVQFLGRQVGSRADAEDVAQNTFIAIHRNLARYDPSRSFVTWMFFIARNKARDHHRRRAVMNWIGLEDREALLPAETPDPEQVTGDKAELARAGAVLKTLPEGLRTPLLLSAVEGLSLAEIGAVMGISSKAAEVRVYRARKRLKELFAREG
ncbi:MAG: RNA polymerase sigma factor [Alphaproteobacteria bacterium]|jgi:RNA polymerase sigma-70 factor (ECF subfamily)|nr:RNA polymerase sigma factor [Alphaproteobacteria bacterium]